METFENIEQINQILVEVSEDKNKFNSIFQILGFTLGNTLNTLFSYPGGKFKMENDLLNIVDNMVIERIEKTGKTYDTFIDVFGGAAGSTLVMYQTLIFSGVRNFILNDIDKDIYFSHKYCKENAEELIKEYCEIIRTKFIIPYGSVFLDLDTLTSIKCELISEYETYAKNNEFNIQRTMRFIFLRGLEYSATLEYHKEGYHRFSKKIYCSRKIYGWIFNQIPKISNLSKIYNEIDLQITNKNAFDILEDSRFKNNPNCLINLDPPYIKEDYKNIYSQEELENLTSNKLADCRLDYNQPKFPHIELLQKFPNINFIYNNNQHQVVTYYKELSNSKNVLFPRKDTMIAKKNESVRVIMEDIVYNNSLI